MKSKAIGKIVHKGRSQYIAEAVIYDSEKREIARGTALLVKKNIELNSLNGYNMNQWRDIIWKNNKTI